LLEKEYEQSAEQVTSDEFNLTEWEAIIEKINTIDEKEAQFEAEYSDEVDQTLKNAYVMPAKLRDLALSFLESQDASFKVGFFQSKRKTAEEKKVRLEAFYSELEQSIQSTIIWKLREKFAQLLQDYQIANDELRDVAQNFSINFSEDDLLASLKQGATVNGNYVLNYTNEITNKIKQQCKRKANEILVDMKTQLTLLSEEKRTPLLMKKEQLKTLRESALEQTTLEEALQDQLNALEKVVQHNNENDKLVNQLYKLIDERYQFIKEDAQKIEDTKELAKITPEQSEQAEQQKQVTKNEINISSEQIIEKIDQTIEHIIDLPDFNSLITDLQSKKTRIEDRSLTIALFGAFSAGKSSFSNALLGERVLPVSPNPTTAVINRIRPTTDQYRSGTVVITYKSDTVLTDDLKGITKEFSPKANN